MIEQAKRLIDLGLPLIPLCDHEHKYSTAKHIQRCKCPGKTPLIRGWQSRRETTEDHLDSWIKQFKEFNIGLPLGAASGYCGIDIDGEEGERFLKEMSGGMTPDTWEFSTGEGRRLLYTIPPGTKTKKFKQASDEGGHQECAILCDGQQTVMPPSIHYTGREYAWHKKKSPWDIDCAPAPRWLLALITITDEEEEEFSLSREFDFNLDEEPTTIEGEFDAFEFREDLPPDSDIGLKKVKAQKGKTGHSITVTDEVLTTPIPEGQRDNTMTAIVGHYCANRDLRRFGKDFILNVCLKHNKEYCVPPLEASDIESKVNYFFELEGMKEAKFKSVGAGKDKKPFEPSKMAAIVKEEISKSNILLHFDQTSKMYYYTSPDKGPWVCTRNTTLVNKWIRSILINPVYGETTWDKTSYIDETRKALEEIFTEAFKQFDDFDIGAHSDELSKYIVVNNGMLDWENNELLEWDPNYYTTIAYDVDYSPNADCPRFEQYMSEWLPTEGARKVIQEFMGYCLIPNTKFRKALFLYGKGKNGKSMLLEFIQDFFGDNKATLAYDTLFQRFGPANLKGKVINVYDDTSVSFVKDTGIIKNLIAGGSIAAEFKGRDHFMFTNVARFIFSSQETPKTSDHTEAWYDRWIFIKFPNKFRPSNAKKTEIQQALAEEKAGIFNWMVEGLKRLIEQDEFTFSEELLISAQDYRGQNDSVARFVSNMCTVDEGISANSLFKIYSIWSEYEGLRPMSKRTFIERMEDLGYTKRKGYIDGKSGQTLFTGIGIDKESEDYQENKLEYVISQQSMG